MKLKGCFPALVTPMKSGNPLNYPLNFDAMKKLVEHAIEGGVDGVVPAGCTGHAASLSWDEQKGLVNYTLEIAKSKVKVIPGDGSNCTREAIRAAKEMEDLGVDTHLMISPYQNKPTQEGLYQHYASIAKAVKGNIIVYNVPGRTGRNIEPETTIRLAKDFSNIAAIKEASGNIEQIKKIIDGTKDIKGFDVLSGDDGLTLDIIKAGGTGCISVAANVDPKRTAAMIHAALEKDYAKADKLNKELQVLFKILFIETNPSPAHYALRKLGIDVGVPRLPLVDVTEESAAKIDEVLQGLKLI